MNLIPQERGRFFTRSLAQSVSKGSGTSGCMTRSTNSMGSSNSLWSKEEGTAIPGSCCEDGGGQCSQEDSWLASWGQKETWQEEKDMVG
jgi:hypothetical protein